MSMRAARLLLIAAPVLFGLARGLAGIDAPSASPLAATPDHSLQESTCDPRIVSDDCLRLAVAKDTINQAEISVLQVRTEQKNKSLEAEVNAPVHAVHDKLGAAASTRTPLVTEAPSSMNRTSGPSILLHLVDSLGQRQGFDSAAGLAAASLQSVATSVSTSEPLTLVGMVVGGMLLVFLTMLFCDFDFEPGDDRPRRRTPRDLQSQKKEGANASGQSLLPKWLPPKRSPPSLSSAGGERPSVMDSMRPSLVPGSLIPARGISQEAGGQPGVGRGQEDQRSFMEDHRQAGPILSASTVTSVSQAPMICPKLVLPHMHTRLAVPAAPLTGPEWDVDVLGGSGVPLLCASLTPPTAMGGAMINITMLEGLIARVNSLLQLTGPDGQLFGELVPSGPGRWQLNNTNGQPSVTILAVDSHFRELHMIPLNYDPASETPPLATATLKPEGKLPAEHYELVASPGVDCVLMLLCVVALLAFNDKHGPGDGSFGRAGLVSRGPLALGEGSI